MKGFRIIEYTPAHARSIADMWNRSTDSWGGSNIVKTEESVLRDHENAANIAVFVAIGDNGDVIGYCSFSRYFNDTGALYIPLLNVRPDWHGKKVGKALVLKAVEKTVEMGWPRLDLFTWPGNTKAVPTYKKCGFFWEKRDDSTHLMNFIPTVLQTEALKEYFQTADWYGDSKRKIEIQPDGLKENGFEYYEYSWQKDGRSLRVRFEKTGRGISLIETDDYKIEAVICNHGLIAGRSCRVIYEAVNKSGKPLEIVIQGRDDGNIRFDLETSAAVKDTEVFEGEFAPELLSEEQNSWRTHPAVCADILINGKQAVFKTGLLLKRPAKLFLHVPWKEQYLNTKLDCWLEAENNFTENAVFDIHIPGNDKVSFSKARIEAALKPGERKLIPFTYSLKEFCPYSGTAAVTAQLESGERISFETGLHAIFKGRSGAFGGGDEHCWYICNGEFSWHLWKHGNRGVIFGNRNDEANTTFCAPGIGMPYSNEFTTARAQKVQYYREAETIVQEAAYLSEDFKGLELIARAKLHPNGILEHSYTLNNLSEADTPADVCFTESVLHDMYRAVLPYDGRFIGLNGSDEGNLGFWDSDRLSENWIFSRSGELARGICWDRDCRVKFDEHSMSFEYNFGRLPGRGSVSTKPLTLSYGAFDSWQDFRAFTLKKMQFAGYRLTESLDILVNGKNPFVRDSFIVDIKEYKSASTCGTVKVCAENGSFDERSMPVSIGGKADTAALRVDFKKDAGTTLIHVEADTDTYAEKRSYIIFRAGDGPVKCETLVEQGMSILKADNGPISIKAAPDFSGKLFSMRHMDREWLDSSFPAPGPRSWWNPWAGGIGTKPAALRDISELQAPKSAAFSEIKDNRGNLWRGIRINVRENENEKLKGLEYNQYFLLLPGAPVMCHTLEVLQNTGRYFNYETFDTDCYFIPDSDILNSSFKVKDSDGQLREYKSGSVQHEIKSSSSVLYGSKVGKGCLQVVSGSEPAALEGFSNRELTAAFALNKLSGAHGARLFTPPLFFVFTEAFIDDGCLKDLKGIRFGEDDGQ